MFPGVIPGSHITRAGVADACELGLKRSGLTNSMSPYRRRPAVKLLTLPDNRLDGIYATYLHRRSRECEAGAFEFEESLL